MRSTTNMRDAFDAAVVPAVLELASELPASRVVGTAYRLRRTLRRPSYQPAEEPHPGDASNCPADRAAMGLECVHDTPE